MKQSISPLILLLSSSFFVALIVVLFFVFYHSPESYKASSVLVKPNFSFKDPKTGRHLRFGLEKIEYTWVDRYGKGWQRFPVTPEGYKEFYANVKGLHSRPHVPNEVVDQYTLSFPSTLTIFVHPRDNQEGEPRVFQQIEFLDDEFRVQLMSEDSSSGSWLYFSSPGLNRKLHEWFERKQLSFSGNGWCRGHAYGWLQLPSLHEHKAA